MDFVEKFGSVPFAAGFATRRFCNHPGLLSIRLTW